MLVTLSGCGPIDLLHPTAEDLCNLAEADASAWTIQFCGGAGRPDPVDVHTDVLRVGETVLLYLMGGGGACTDHIAQVQWMSTNPGAATVRDLGASSTPIGIAIAAELTGVAVGDTMVFADIETRQHHTFHAGPEFCNGTSITRIRVVQP